ncbi:MAG TPA: hypothetical protein VN520_00560 [Streptomyces sp.]|uniref:hypothetical protein n=1 Tax=Streptomyces sp. TaxID=1931 RepID=UPI002C9A9EF5|nr:hypothetical protein [Streptomyces sp.]HWU04898.1 hypothetical protein [Streptomyces sp.]
MTTSRAPASPAVRRRIGPLLGLCLVLALSACSSEDRATGPGELRELAGSAGAQESRATAERHLRAVVQAYDRRTPLTLGLVTVEDVCAGGAAKQWLLPSGDEGHRVSCTMRVTAYYGAGPGKIGDVLDGVFTAGDRDSSAGVVADAVPFGHDHYRRALVDHYRGRGPNPAGPDTPEPTQVSDPSQTLSWDTVRSSPKTLVADPDPQTGSDPPVTRHLREPASATVPDIRERYGMVFELKLSPTEYYRVSRKGATVRTE